MAKRKNAIALFEVITAAKRKEREAEIRQSLNAPRWWFKGKGGRGEPAGVTSSALAPGADVDPTSPAYVAASFAAPHAAVAQPAIPASPEIAETSDAAVEPTPAPAPVAAQAASPAENPSPAPAGRWSALWPRFGLNGIKKLRLDPDRQEVTLRFRYTTAIIAGFAIVVALGLAFVTGRRAAAPNSRSTADVQSGQILAGVLIPDDEQISTDPIAASDSVPAAEQGNPEVVAPARPDGGAAPAGPADRWTAPGIETRLPRVIGQNYVIVQSYLKRDDADAARDALVAAGIPCTVERVPRSWSDNRNLFSVIGTHGFARPKSMREYKAYEAAINQVSKAFAGKSKYKQFEPTAYRWKQEDADAAR